MGKGSNTQIGIEIGYGYGRSLDLPFEAAVQQTKDCCSLTTYGAEGGTRTPTGFPTTPSRWRVCQFHHFGTGAEPLGNGREPLTSQAVWADPDLEQAAWPAPVPPAAVSAFRALPLFA